MGSELYAFFSVKGEGCTPSDLDDLEEDAGATALGHDTARPWPSRG